MRIRRHGKVTDHLWHLGHEESCIYLLEGHQESMIISGGMSYIMPRVLQQMNDFGIDRARIKKILILHSHFDHTGIVPSFKRTQPDLVIYGSARAWEILNRGETIQTINAFSKKVAERMGMLDVCSAYDLDWRNDISGQKVREGDQFDLGGVDVHVLETPGHSSCSISAYVPQLKALFPSDGGGIPFKDTIITSGNSNFTKFQQSLEKLEPLEVDYYCADHYGYVTGDEARNFISSSIDFARERRSRMERVYRKTGDVNGAAAELVTSFFLENPDYLLPREIFEGVFRQMVRHIAGTLKG
jgi:glyoxylase-like metal-dependent hydrolase (beta-lactamase superfamily II)